MSRRHPNLLFLFTDEQRHDTLAAYGNDRIQMPNLNRFAEQATIYERAYCTQPVCTASRSSILTGLFPHANGCTENNVPLRADVPCLVEMLPDRRYVTGYHGKWHLGDEVFRQRGFDDWVSIEDYYADVCSPGRDRATRSSYHHFLMERGFTTDRPNNSFSRTFAARVPEECGKPAFLAREASRFIREHQRDPFVLYVNFLEPHMPFFGPRDNQYDPAHVPLPGNFANPPTAQQHLKSRLIREAYRERGIGLPLKTEADWRRLIANYWGLNSLVDTHAGTILRTVEDCGLMDDTIIVFTSDHGDMMGSHQLVAKCVMYEEAIRVPLLIKPAGRAAPRRVTKPVSLVDLVPTLLKLMDCPVPAQLPESTADVFVEWNGRETGVLEAYDKMPLPDSLSKLATKDQMSRAVIDPLRTVITPAGWKFTLSELGQHELYDLRSDPFEINNLAFEPSLHGRMEQLTAKIRAWQTVTADA